MGRSKKYNARTLEKAVDAYFDSITREVGLTEQVDTGRKDRKGHAVFEARPITNKLGRPVRVTEYVVPPSVRDLCEFLGITGATWANYANRDKCPELAGIALEVYERMKAWNERELVTRAGKNVRGIIFNLQNNYGYGAKMEGPSAAAQEDDPITKSLKEAADALAKANEDPPVALHGEDRADL